MTAHARLWTNRRYLLWLAGDTGKGLATSLAAFAVPLIALAATDDPAQAGIIGGVGLIIRLVITLYGGVLADRRDRIALMILGALVGGILSAGFTLLSLADALAFATLLLVESLLMVRAGLFEPAAESAIKQLVPDEQMGRAQAANQGRDAALQLAGAPLGGLLLGVGAWLVGAVMTAAYAVAVVLAWALRRTPASVPPSPSETEDETDASGRVAPRHADAAVTDPEFPTPAARGGVGEIRDGFRFLFSRPDMGGVLLIISFVTLGFNAVITTIIYALQQSGHSELEIGTMYAVIGIVMGVGAAVSPWIVPRVGAGVLTAIGLTGTTTAGYVVAFVEHPIGIVVVMALAVLVMPALTAAMLGYFVVATPSELLGRANAAVSMVGMAAMTCGPLIAGYGLSLFGRRPTILGCAAICTIALVFALSSRALRAIPAEAGWAAHAARFAREP